MLPSLLRNLKHLDTSSYEWLGSGLQIGGRILRGAMTIEWKNVFDAYGVKRVTKTDKNKGAYVPNREQRIAIEAAGTTPKQGFVFDVAVLFDSGVKSVKASYYYSERSAEANRTPEPRMGHEIISSWLNEGDHVLIGNLGSQVFAVKLQMAPANDEDAIIEIAKKANRQTVFDLAKKATGKPARRTVRREDFVRNPYVVVAVLMRANGKCEMPGCTCPLFLRDDSSPYLEVHHVVPLGESGDDTLVNAAALCPHCHRELHFGKNRKTLRAALATHIAKLLV
jgi:hypothetical protein